MSRLTSFLLAPTLFLIASTVTQSHAQTPTPTPTPGLTAEQKKLVDAARDAIKAANSAIAASEGRLRTASAHVDLIKSLVASRKADDVALRDLEDLIDVVGNVGDAKFYKPVDPESGHPVLKALKDAEDKLTAAAMPLAGDTQPAEIVSARTDVKAAHERITAEKDAVKKTRADLATAIGSIYGFANSLPTSWIRRLKPLNDLAVGAAVGDVRRILPRQLATFREVERLSRELGPLWETLKEGLTPLGLAPTPAVDVDGQITAVRTQVRGIVGKAQATPGWLATLVQGGTVESQNITTKRNQVRSDPVANSAIAVQTLREGSPWVDELRRVHAEWISAQTQLADADDLDFNPEAAREAANQLELSARSVRGSLADLQDALVGDFSNFQADQVSLFYFSDVPRLMQILNPETYEVGGIRSAGEEAAKQRRELTKAELDLADAQSEVNAAQQRVLVLREELRQANASADSTNQIFKRTSLSLKGAQRDKEANDKRFNDAQCDPAPTDPEKRARCENLASERDKANSRVEAADQRNNDADSERKQANERRDTLRDEQNGLPSKIADAESKLETAQAAVTRQRRTALLAAQAESEAFAKARDNRPFWFAPANASSTDPAKHVIMWAFNDSKTIFLRGKLADLKAVKCIIAKIDQPAPQARMTLWTLELNSDASVSGTTKANKAFELIDRRLSNTRALNAAALSLLRDVINENVNIVAQGVFIHPAPAGPGAAPRKADHFRLARMRFYSDEILYRLGFNPDRLFDPAVTDPEIARLIVPDPAGTTTLGEALMVLNLGKAQYRYKIITDFASRLPNYLRGLGLIDLPPELVGLDRKNESGTLPALNWFPSLRRASNLDAVAVPLQNENVLTAAQEEALRALGVNEANIRQIKSAPTRATQIAVAVRANLSDAQIAQVFNSYSIGSGGLSAAQLEILHAMEEVAKDRLLNSATLIYTSLVRKEDEIRTKRQELRTRNPSVSSQLKDLDGPPPCPNMTIFRGDLATTMSLEDQLEYNALEKEYCGISNNLRRIISNLRSTGISWERVKATAEARMRAGDDVAAQEAEDKWNKMVIQESCTSPLRTANAREAAADQMLKDMIIAVEDDLDRLFVQPMLTALRKDLVSKAGIGVGIIQRTSILATNRLLARVDPRSSAQLAMGQTTDVLQAAQQLSQIFFAAQSGGALGALGALKALPQKPQSELYGLTTGNVFQVTPIFDPSGQALRFKFDYVGASQIREPNGTVNPQLPRIERHTVNTEVQLSNLELREISRFESNARLGIATRYAGGLPLLKDIPYVKYIPLIGWFVRTSGKAAVTQQSLIFGQTTMYPTIGDIMGLLTTDVYVGQ